MFLYESRALSTGFGGLRASWPLGPLWPRKHQKHRTCRAFSTSAPRQHRTCRTLAPCALAGACSVPRGRSKVLLEPPLGGPRALEGAARASIWCPRALQGAAPASSLQPPLGAPGVLEGAAPACSVPHVRALRHFAPLLGQRVLELPPGSLSARDDGRECCAKNLCSAAPKLRDTALCSTSHRAWICTGSH